jgi:hypothetical protein
VCECSPFPAGFAGRSPHLIEKEREQIAMRNARADKLQQDP